MVSRRTVFSTSILATAVSFFTLGVVHSRSEDASYDAKLEAIRAEVRIELGRTRTSDAVVPAGTSGQTAARADSAEIVPGAARTRMIAEIKKELQHEMGLMPV